MLRRLGAVAAGLFACQMAMLVCLALAVGLLVVLPDWPLLVIGGAGVLMLAPGLIGGGLAGVVMRRGALLQGALIGLLFGLSVVLVKLFVAPSLGYGPMPYDIAVYPALLIGLIGSGAAGGQLATRWRPLDARGDRRAAATIAAPGQ